jgi:hypothetical protein
LRYIIKTRHIFLNLVNMQKNTYIANNNLFWFSYSKKK